MKKLHVVLFSGGKDSTAMLLRMVEENRPIDLIIFCDTGLEFPEMLEHVNKVEKYINRPIIRLKADKDYMYWAAEHKHVTKSNNLAGYKAGDVLTGYGWSSVLSRWCTKALKSTVIDKYVKELKKDHEIIRYAGIAIDEPKRIKDLNYPLVEWGMTEADCLAYCKARGFDWGGLYDVWGRVSCWCCPLQSLDDLRKLKHYRPELWEKLHEMNEQLAHTTRSNFKGDVSLDDIEKRFDLEDEFLAQGKKLRTKEFFNEMKKRNIKY